MDDLLDLAREKFKRLLDEKSKLAENGVCVKVIGNIGLLPDDIQKLIFETEECTKNNQGKRLNVAFAYTSRDEMTQVKRKDLIKIMQDLGKIALFQAVRHMAKGVQENVIEESDIDQDLMERCLYTKDSSKVDLLIRTSGEVRLSEFLLWQTSFSVIYFTRVLWPEFSFQNLVAGIFFYQRNRRRLDRIMDDIESLRMPRTGVDQESAQKEARVRKFLELNSTWLFFVENIDWNVRQYTLP